jgi:3-deoxy-D-manno-octulosonic-acid transferase
MIFLDIGYFILLALSIPLWIQFLILKRYRRLFKHRFSPALEPGIKKSLWIHAVSVGEVRSLENLISQLSTTHKNIILSVTTPSGYDYARKTLSGIRVINSPLDFSFVIKKFLKILNPHLLILNELEIWPNWLSIMEKNRIPVVVINGRISEPAYRKYKKCRWLFKKYFNMVDFYFLQSEVHRERFKTFDLPESKLKVCGNIKADEASALKKSLPPRTEILNHLKLSAGRKKIIVLASTHATDEKIIFSALPALIDKYALIIVPRHPHRTVQIEKQLEKLGLSHATWSRSSRINPDESVFIFDRIGYLFPILAISDLVFMGGTFQKKIGGHNLYEPAIHSKIILGGPWFNNFPDIGAELVKKGVYRIIRDGPDFKATIQELEGLDLEKMGQQALNTVLDQKGSTECILNQLQSFIRD